MIAPEGNPLGQTAASRAHLTTEARNPAAADLDRATVREAFDLINRQDATVATAVAAASEAICRAIEMATGALQGGGRLIYVGAGSSGRLGVMDAAECPPTFLTAPETVQGVIAGGRAALTRSVEGAEDDPAGGAAEMDRLGVGDRDVVFAIATGGTTPFVHGAVARAKQRNAGTVFFACVPADQVADEADVSIRVITGPEVLAGSTRMKAGTATKMVLNMVTTITMVRLGKTFGNLMIDVNAGANDKLRDRATRMIQTVTGCSADESRTLLDRADGRVKRALVMHDRGVSGAKAERLLASVGGRVARLMLSDQRSGAVM